LGFFFFEKDLTENRDTGENAPTSNVHNLDTLQSTTELSRKKGKDDDDKSVQSTNNTPKSTTSRSINPMAHHNKKETRSSSNGGDKDPPHPKIDTSHKLPMDKKRKQIVGQAKEPEIQSKNMELEPDLNSVFCYLDQPSDMIHHSLPMDIYDTEHFDEDESFMFLSVVFDNQSKKIIIEKKDVKNKKGKSHSEVNLANMRPSQIYQLHIVIGDSLDDSIGSIEAENAIMKDRVKELEESLIPMPLLVNPLEITMPKTPEAKLK
jgi:hypothetical protein